MSNTGKDPLFFTLSVEALEDLQIGSGTGGGDLDEQVQRDRYGMPVVRASHIKGLLREAGKELVRYGKTSPEDLTQLLGSSGGKRGSLKISSLTVSQGGETLTWISTSRKKDSRSPEDDTLRRIEHVAAGTHFTCTMRLANPELLPLMERLFARIDRLGGNRNRGSGLVKIDCQPKCYRAIDVNVSDTATDLRIIFRNIEPLCLPTTGYPGNLIESHSFVRGQVLIGALKAWLINNGQPEQIGLFDQIQVTDAFPMPTGETDIDKVLPIPLSVLTQKPIGISANLPWWVGEHTVREAADELCSEIDFTEEPKPEKPKRPGTHEYIFKKDTDDIWYRYSPRMHVRMRNATPDKRSDSPSELFSVEEVGEDTCFQCDLHFSDKDQAGKFVRLLTPVLSGCDWLTLGRGGQPAMVDAVFSTTERLKQEHQDQKFTDSWTLTLISDAIVRGKHLGFLDTLDIKTLCQIAGQEFQSGWVLKNKPYVETTLVYGFNAVTGLPRSTNLAIRRGSCWFITGEGSSQLAKSLSEIGCLGERTKEGFGRFAIDIQPIEELRDPPQRKNTIAINRNEELLAEARKLSSKLSEKGPSLSQLQWLRNQALAAKDTADINSLINEIATAPDRRPQGGKAWKLFPVDDLLKALNQVQADDKNRELVEKRQLISYVVQHRVPHAKEVRQ